MLFGAMQYFMYRYTLVSTEKANQMLENTMYSATAQVENMVGAITNATYLFQANGTTSGSIIDELQKYKDMNYDMSYYDLYTPISTEFSSYWPTIRPLAGATESILTTNTNLPRMTGTRKL